MTVKGGCEVRSNTAVSRPFSPPTPSPKFCKWPQPIKKRKVIVISGPTAVGKTTLSLKIAKVLGGEIISADSMQVYYGMDIGTAKVSEKERKSIPHHLIDIRLVKERFNVVDFYHEAMACICDIESRGAVPIVVGGTGFYIHALLYGPPPGPASDPHIRMQLEEELDRTGIETLYAKLCILDPIYASTISNGDKQKIIRALEIILLTNQKVSSLKIEKEESEDIYDFRCWFLHMPKEQIYKRIEDRCEEMVEQGLIEEVKRLKTQGLEQNSSASQAIGYRQTLDFLDTKQTPEEFAKFKEKFKQASRRYAKRQFTWFRKEPLFKWLDMSELGTDAAMEIVLQDYEIGI